MMNIFLVRHGESESNVDRSIGMTKADHAVELTDLGKEQARGAGRFLQERLRGYYSEGGAYKIRMWNSPYLRTRQTADAIEEECEWFYDRREHILLCEQQFGLFDGVPEDQLKELYPNEQEHYQKCMDQEGRFWARLPLGESRFDVATRIHQCFGTFHRDADKHGINTLVVVCHGVTMRAFLMMWLHLTPEWFDEEPNPGNCSIRLIQGSHDKGYIYTGEDT